MKLLNSLALTLGAAMLGRASFGGNAREIPHAAPGRIGANHSQATAPQRRSLRECAIEKRLAAHRVTCLQVYQAKLVAVKAGKGRHTLRGIPARYLATSAAALLALLLTSCTAFAGLLHAAHCDTKQGCEVTVYHHEW